MYRPGLDALGKTSPCRQSRDLCRSQFTFFRVTGCRGGRLQVLFRRSPNFHHRLPATVTRRSLNFSLASRQSRHWEMLIGPGLADNRIEKRTAEKANFVPEST